MGLAFTGLVILAIVGAAVQLARGEWPVLAGRTGKPGTAFTVGAA